MIDEGVAYQAMVHTYRLQYLEARVTYRVGMLVLHIFGNARRAGNLLSCTSIYTTALDLMIDSSQRGGRWPSGQCPTPLTTSATYIILSVPISATLNSYLRRAGVFREHTCH